MSNKIDYINFTIRQINDASDEVYECFFETDEELVESIRNLIELLTEIKKDYE